MNYEGPERRQTSPDTILILGKIQEIAVSSAQVAENVRLLREDWTASKLTMASCDDVSRIERKVDDHIAGHATRKRDGSENRKWKIATVIALAFGIIQGVPGLYAIFRKGAP